MLTKMDSPPQTTPAWLLSFSLPGILMVVQAGYLILTGLLNPHLVISLQIERLQSKSFALSWACLGKVLADDFPSPHLDDIIGTHCRGRVLDIGPGTGFQMKRFTPAKAQIERVYGVEPGVEMHAQLQAEATRVLGTEAKYVVLSCGAQPGELVPVLAREGLLSLEQGKREKVEGGSDGGFDTIVSIRALCGIPEPRETLELFYRLLRPGGRLIFFEHVANSGDGKKGGTRVARVIQHLYMLVGWKFLAGGCELTRDTEQYVVDAAKSDSGWAVKEIYHRNVAGCIPEIYGYVQKRR